MIYQSYTLSNGLRIVHKPSDGKVSYCGFIVNAGTRDEASDEHGMAHFVEHMLFKGTKLRRSHHIINRMEKVGGELNAYTNKEETVIYSVFLEEHFNRAIELLNDLVFHSEFPQKEIDKEIDVVIDEIHSYEDSPSELIYDDFENLVFEGSDIGHNILGTPESLMTFDSKKAKAFVERNYVPSNMVFFSMGKTDFGKIVYQAEKYLGGLVNKEHSFVRQVPLDIAPQRLRLNKDTIQAHALIGSRSYPILDKKRQALHLLNNILGGPGMNSRLNISLREKKGYVYNIDSSVTAYSDTGLFSIYFGCDKKNMDRCVQLVQKELRQLREISLTSSQLISAKKQLIGQIGVSSDQKENVALGLGKTFMYFNHIRSLEEIFERVESLTTSQIQGVANEIFDENRMFSLIYN